MDGMERRSRERCPVCQGPMRQVEQGEARCRTSVCPYNHRDKTCPRCKTKGPDVSRYEQGIYHYVCKDCQNKWQEG
jgi:hypothetical protein